MSMWDAFRWTTLPTVRKPTAEELAEFDLLTCKRPALTHYDWVYLRGVDNTKDRERRKAMSARLHRQYRNRPRRWNYV